MTLVCVCAVTLVCVCAVTSVCVCCDLGVRVRCDLGVRVRWSTNQAVFTDTVFSSTTGGAFSFLLKHREQGGLAPAASVGRVSWPIACVRLHQRV